MLDVVFILLIFFVVTATFLSETAISAASSDSDNDQPPPETDMEDRNILFEIGANNEIILNRNPRPIISTQIRSNIDQLRAENPRRDGDHPAKFDFRRFHPGDDHGRRAPGRYRGYLDRRSQLNSRWNKHEARTCANELELRAYTSRLLGQDPSLVLHGGGNTSVKGDLADVFGETRRVLFVKGSGWDLKSIGAAGFAPTDLNYLLRLAGT